MNAEENKVADLIKSKFPSWDHCYDNLSFGSKTENQLRALMDSVFHFKEEELPAMLGAILYSLLKSHPPTLKHEQCYTKLMLFLDADYDDKEFGEAVALAEHICDVSIESEEIKEVTLDQQILFGRYLKNQAEVVYGWLVLAENWECSSQLLIEFESAKKFWNSLKQRVAH